MSLVASARRSRSVFEEQDDMEQSLVSGSAKRQRLDSSDKEDSDDDDPFRTPERPPPSKNRLQQTNGDRVNGTPSVNGLVHGHGGDGFQPGAIVRVLVENFVTYERAEFLPGPSLNMVIGPNGTGKSSLVCAIALGLGFKPNVLGRASDVKEFVKHGTDTAFIEIELQKRPKDRENPIVRVQITREDNRMKWYLNGKEAPQKDIQKLIRDFQIQVDNLCQFLPQDKVAEFAGLTPIALLQETLKAAAPQEMIKEQEKLKEYHRSYKIAKANVEQYSETLKEKEARQETLQADVDRLREREEIEKRIDDWQKARACAEYSEARITHKKALSKKKESEERLLELEKASGPALEAVTQKEDYQAKVEAVLDERKRALRAVEATAVEGLQTIEAHSEKLNNLESKKKAEDNSNKTRKDAIQKLRHTITTLKAKQKKEPPEFNAGEWNTKIREHEHRLREITSERREIEEGISQTKEQGRGLNQELKRIANEIKILDSQEGQQLSYLKRNYPDVAAGWDWLRENQDKFEKQVFGPPIITCSLNDMRYSDVVQSLLGEGDFVCFTAQTKDDHKKLSHHFYKEMGLSVSIRSCAWELGSFKSPVPLEEVQRLGLDGYAISYLEGPEPVLAMLCSEKKLHASGVALKEIQGDQFNELVNGQRINFWSSGQTNYRVIRRREYGSDATTTSTRKVRTGRFWTDQPVDNSEKIQLQNEHRQKEMDKDTLVQELRDKERKKNELSENHDQMSQELGDIRRQKNELQVARTQWEALPHKISSEEDKLASLQAQVNEWRARMANLEAEHDDILLEKARAILSYKDMVSQIRDTQQALLDVEIRLVEAVSDVAGLKERNAGIVGRLDRKKEEIAIYAAEADASKREAQKARRKVEGIAAGPEDLRHYQSLVEGKMLDDIDHEIGAEEAKLGLIHGPNPGVLQQFKKRAEEIEALKNNTEAATEKLERLVEQMGALMRTWEPKLDQVVSNIDKAFSTNFERISCAGEVGVHKDEDFDHWAIEIKVKFRKNETLQQLTSHRQSGGERAVSTIFYLMALQSMAQAPFRVVDEINQGMDPRNERMVHERMVEIACREHTSQYFLITPKLLSGLRYDERMRVLCIASGEHMPDEGHRLNFSKLIGIQHTLKAGA